MKPLKILLPVHVFFPEHFYGTETYTLQLAQQLIALGHNPTVLTATPYGEKGDGREYTFYDYEGVRVCRIDLNLKPHNRFKHTYYRRDLYPLLKKLVLKIGPDIVHVTHLINHSATLLEVIRDLKIPAVATLTDFFGICLNNKLERYDGIQCQGPSGNFSHCLACYFRADGIRKPKRILSRLARKSDFLLRSTTLVLPYMMRIPGFQKTALAGHVMDVMARQRVLRYLYGVYRKMIAPSQFLHDSYVKNGFYPDRLEKINFGINLDLVSQFSQPRIKKGKNIRFGYIGQLSHHKGIDLLIKAFCSLKGDNKSLFIYGPADQDPAYMEELKKLSENDANIHFKGTFPQKDLGERLSELDFLVIPSRWHENSPLVLLYALATRTPVIVTDVKGLSEFVIDDFNGYTFKKDSHEHLGKIMEKIIHDPARVTRLSKNATYTKDVSDHAAEVLQIYTSVLSG